MSKQALMRLVAKTDHFDIVDASLLVAKALAYPALNLADERRELSNLSAAFLARESEMLPSRQRALDLAQRLVLAGFQGNDEEFGDPRNSLLNDVLRRRIGLPIALSTIYVAVARAVGLEAFGVGLPGHYVAGVHAADEVVYIDLYHGSQPLSAADCEGLVRQSTSYEGDFQSAWLDPVPARDTLARTLNNLRLAYAARSAWPKVVQVGELLTIVQPDVAFHYRDMAIAHYQCGHITQAALAMERYFAEAPDAPDIGLIRASAQAVMRAWARQN